MEENKINKISRVIVRPTENFCLRIHVKLIRENKGRKHNFHNVFVANDGQGYLTLDLQSFLTLEIRDGMWAPDKSIIIDQKNIPHLLSGMKKSLDGIYNGGVFAVNKKGETIIYKDMRDKHTVRIYNLGMNQRLVIQPAIIYDENETTYEGVIMFLNKTGNYVELPIDAFESLYYALKQTNIFVYSQLLVNYYVTTLKNVKLQIQQTTSEDKTKMKKKHPLTIVSSDEEFTKSTLQKPKTEEEFFGFVNKE